MPRKRNLDKVHELMSFHVPGDAKRTKLRVTPKGPPYEAERRRINPPRAYELAKTGEIKGTARELFVNLGVEARGLGTKKAAKRRKYSSKPEKEKNYLKNLVQRFVDGQITKNDYKALRAEFLKFKGKKTFWENSPELAALPKPSITKRVKWRAQKLAKKIRHE
ncbi:MAG: hypothetical protein NUV67_05520 [archaeon]|nr:hypothetical protein [archaeon]